MILNYSLPYSSVSHVPPTIPHVYIADKAKHLVADLDGDLIIMSMETGTYYGLDAVGANVWKLLARPHRLDDVVAHVLDRFDVDAETAERDLTVLLNEMRSEGLISITVEARAD